MKASQQLALIKTQVKEDYFNGNYRTESDLAVKYNISLNTLKDWLYKGSKKELAWRREKEELSKSIKQKAVEQATQELSSALQMSATAAVTVLDKIMKGIAEGLHDPKHYPKIFTAIAGGFKNIHSILRLENGQSTVNVAAQSGVIDLVAVEEAFKGFMDDPFRQKALDVDIESEDYDAQ